MEPPVSVPIAHGARPAATAAALPPLDPPGTLVVVPRVLHRAEAGVLVRRAHGELVHVGLAEQRGARRGEAAAPRWPCTAGGSPRGSATPRRWARPRCRTGPSRPAARPPSGPSARRPAPRRPPTGTRSAPPRRRARGRRSNSSRARQLAGGDRARPPAAPVSSSRSALMRPGSGTRKPAPSLSGACSSACSRGRLGRGTSSRSTFSSSTTCEVGSTPVEVELGDLLDVVEHLRQLAGHRLDLVVGEPQPGEAGDVEHLFAVDHRRAILGGPWFGHSGVRPSLNALAPIAWESRRMNIDMHGLGLHRQLLRAACARPGASATPCRCGWRPAAAPRSRAPARSARSSAFPSGTTSFARPIRSASSASHRPAGDDQLHRPRPARPPAAAARSSRRPPRCSSAAPARRTRRSRPRS